MKPGSINAMLLIIFAFMVLLYACGPTPQAEGPKRFTVQSMDPIGSFGRHVVVIQDIQTGQCYAFLSYGEGAAPLTTPIEC